MNMPRLFETLLDAGIPYEEAERIAAEFNPVGSTALRVVAGQKPMSLSERCKQLNEEIRQESKCKQQLAASIILDGVIEPN